MDVGARLKEARIEKGLSLESLQETTKIQKRYLVAIEEGNFQILPGKFYARAFIKEYANAVGINPDKLLEEHKEEIPESQEESEVRYTRLERSRRESNDRNGAIFSVLPKIIVVLLIVGILVAAIWFYTQSQSSTEPTEIEDSDGNVIITNPDGGNNGEETPVEDEDDETEETEEDTEEESEETTEEETNEGADEVSFEVDEIGEGSTPESTITLTNPDDELIFEFSTETEVWIAITNNSEESFFTGIVESANSPVSVDLSEEETVHLNIGSAPNLNIQINGVEFEYPIDPNESDHQRLIINIE